MELTSLKTNLDKLLAGALFRSVQKENGEPENIALGQISKELRYLQRQSEYAREIERVLKELRLTTSLISGCRTIELPAGVSRQELLSYYQGSVLTLVHQMKDKVVQLVHLTTEDTVPERPTLENDISVADLLRRKLQLLEEIGIVEDIKLWEQDHPTSGIAVALRKRTFHHHRVSGLRYDKDFVNLGFTDIATQPSFQQNLSDYGKEQIEKMRSESTERLFSGALEKAEKTLQEIEENVEKISGALVSHLKLPTSQEEVAKIMSDQSAMLGSFDVVNRCSYDKVPQPHKALLEDLLSIIRAKQKDKVVAIYLVGSLGRGEYEEGYSDINLYIVLNVEDEVGQLLREDFNFSLRVFSQEEFLSDACKKFRIITKAVGILLYGTDLAKDEKLPKAGLFLALILNEDILATLDEAAKWTQENPTATPMQISRKSRRLAKRLIDFIYGVVMSNKPQFTASRKERVEKIIEMYPENQKMLETLVGVSRYGVGEAESFNNMVEGFRPKAKANLKKMREVKTALEK